VESGGVARVFIGVVVGVKCEGLIATISSAQTPDSALSRAPKQTNGRQEVKGLAWPIGVCG
jgi:hypothetical protein